VLKVCKPGFTLTESGQKTLKVSIHSMGVDSGRQGGSAAHWIFIDGTNKVEGGLIVLFLILFLPLVLLGNYFADALNSHLPCVQHKKWIV